MIWWYGDSISKIDHLDRQVKDRVLGPATVAQGPPPSFPHPLLFPPRPKKIKTGFGFYVVNEVSVPRRIPEVRYRFVP